jgi:hypothetical protein
VSNQLALYPAVNSAVYTYRGGVRRAKGANILESWDPLLGPCWHHFALLGAS